MKTLYVQLTSSSVPKENVELEVLNCVQNESFCNLLGYELVNGIRIDGTLCQKYIKPKDLLLDFATVNKEVYQSILYQWESIQCHLLDTMPEPHEICKIVIPQEFIEWLCNYSSNGHSQEYKVYTYRQVGEKLMRNNNVRLSANELYNELIKPIEMRIQSCVYKYRGKLDRFVFSEGGIKSSSRIVKMINEMDNNAVFYRLFQWQQENQEYLDFDNYSCSNQEFTVNGVTFTMVYVKAGSFYMGSDETDNERPIHLVMLSRDYYIGRFPVTQELWRAVMGTEASCYFKGDRLPVESVTWDECQVFTRRLSELTGEDFRLPTEAQWEYAARGGIKSRGYKYSGSDNLDEVAWYEGNSEHKTHEVGMKRLNELGIYDMSGNVWEWCNDKYRSSYISSDPVVDPKGCCDGSCRVYRGGSWNFNAKKCRSAERDFFTPNYRNNSLGFRLAMYL